MMSKLFSTTRVPDFDNDPQVRREQDTAQLQYMIESYIDQYGAGAYRTALISDPQLAYKVSLNHPLAQRGWDKDTIAEGWQREDLYARADGLTAQSVK